MAQQYNEQSIEMLDPITAVRRRTGMYLGGRDSEAVFQTVLEVISNSIDEYMNGYGDTILVKIDKNNTITVVDNGRGIPYGIMANGKSALENILTTNHSGSKFQGEGSGYSVSGGANGTGLLAINATAKEFNVIVKRDGKIVGQSYSRGKKLTEVVELGKTLANETGTTISWIPDDEIFDSIEVDIERVKETCEELAYLTKGLTFIVEDAQGNQTKFFNQNGLEDYIKKLTKGSTLIGPTISIVGERENCLLELVFQYTSEPEENIKLYTNNIPNKSGTHLTGMRSAFTRVLNNYGKSKNLLKDNLDGKYYREGLAAVLSVKMVDPVFGGGQTKESLSSADVRGKVDSIVSDFLSSYLEANPKVAKLFIEKAKKSKKAEEAAKKAREKVINATPKPVVAAALLPGKLVDCISRDINENELFLCEGDSAAGSLVAGRDANYQAVLGLRGKILNVEKATEEKMLSNKEIMDIISAIGCGFGRAYNPKKLRYGKIIVATDADVDGSSIAVLCALLLFKTMPKLYKKAECI